MPSDADPPNWSKANSSDRIVAGRGCGAAAGATPRPLKGEDDRISVERVRGDRPNEQRGICWQTPRSSFARSCPSTRFRGIPAAGTCTG